MSDLSYWHTYQGHLTLDSAGVTISYIFEHQGLPDGESVWAWSLGGDQSAFVFDSFTDCATDFSKHLRETFSVHVSIDEIDKCMKIMP